MRKQLNAFLKRLTPQVSIGLMATFVSLCSLFVSIYQTQMSRQQQYASVWPNLLIFNTSRVDDDSISAGYTLWNQGIGPAIIKEVKVFYNGQCYSEASDAFKAICKDKGFDFKNMNSSINSMSPGFSFVPNQNWDWVMFYGKAGHFFTQYSHLLCIQIRSSSVYGEEWFTQIGCSDVQIPQKVID